ncbi:MAG: hypothetical protein LZF60_140150 [Nitrospira sp.]|nr:MAG: hypothetical protein LZF60_140150 [Nitrospira sp.]
MPMAGISRRSPAKTSNGWSNAAPSARGCCPRYMPVWMPWPGEWEKRTSSTDACPMPFCWKFLPTRVSAPRSSRSQCTNHAGTLQPQVSGRPSFRLPDIEWGQDCASAERKAGHFLIACLVAYSHKEHGQGHGQLRMEPRHQRSGKDGETWRVNV